MEHPVWLVCRFPSCPPLESDAGSSRAYTLIMSSLPFVGLHFRALLKLHRSNPRLYLARVAVGAVLLGRRFQLKLLEPLLEVFELLLYVAYEAQRDELLRAALFNVAGHHTHKSFEVGNNLFLLRSHLCIQPFLQSSQLLAAPSSFGFQSLDSLFQLPDRGLQALVPE